MANPRWVPSYTNSGERIAVRLGRRQTRGKSASTTCLDPRGQLTKTSNRRTSDGGGKTESIWRNNGPDSIFRLKGIGNIYKRQGQREEEVKNEGDLHICHNVELVYRHYVLSCLQNACRAGRDTKFLASTNVMIQLNMLDLDQSGSSLLFDRKGTYEGTNFSKSLSEGWAWKNDYTTR